MLSRAEDDAMSLCSSTHGDFPRHLVPIEVKRLNACRDTGETILHKAARMNYYVCIVHYKVENLISYTNILVLVLNIIYFKLNIILSMCYHLKAFLFRLLATK